MLLALYDGALDRLELAADAIRRDDRLTALRMLTRAEVLVCELAGIVDPDYKLADQALRLYGLASQAISSASLDGTEVALRILRSMREAVEPKRDQAVQLERDGALPPLREFQLVHTIA